MSTDRKRHRTHRYYPDLNLTAVTVTRNTTTKGGQSATITETVKHYTAPEGTSDAQLDAVITSLRKTLRDIRRHTMG